MAAWHQHLGVLYYYLQQRHLRRFSSRAALEQWQERRAQRLLAEVAPRSPYTRARLAGRSPSDWRLLPVMGKDDWMAHFDELNTAGLRLSEALAVAEQAERTRDVTPTLRGYTVGLSSGTSGKRGVFLISPRERWQWAGTLLARLLPGGVHERHRVAFFLRSNSTLYTTVGSRRLAFAYFELQDELERHIDRLCALQPTVLVAPPAMLRLLAREGVAGPLKISPRLVVSVADVLETRDARVIADAFEQPVRQVYQATEGFLGVTCSHGTLHLNEDGLIVERDYLDAEAGTFVPVLTDLFRTTQPLIRYRLEDVLTERAAPCPCGSVLTPLERIDGRCDDVFYLYRRDRNAWRPIFPDTIRRAVWRIDATIEHYRVRQMDPGRVEVQVEAERVPHLEDHIRAVLEDLCASHGCEVPDIQVVPYRHEPSASAKRRRVQRMFAVDAEGAPPDALLRPRAGGGRYGASA